MSWIPEIVEIVLIETRINSSLSAAWRCLELYGRILIFYFHKRVLSCFKPPSHPNSWLLSPPGAPTAPTCTCSDLFAGSFCHLNDGPDHQRGEIHFFRNTLVHLPLARCLSFQYLRLPLFLTYECNSSRLFIYHFPGIYKNFSVQGLIKTSQASRISCLFLVSHL